MKGKIVMVEADKLQLNTLIRTDKNEDTLNKNLENLETSIRTMRGIKQPLLVTANGNKFLIITGNKRFLAGKKAGLKAFPCIVMNDITPENVAGITELGVSENLMRQDLTKSQKISFIRKVMGGGDEDKIGEITLREIAAATGLTYKQVQKLSLQKKLSPKIKQMLDEHKISSSATEDLAPLTPTEQEKVVKDLRKAGLRLSQDNIRKITGRRPHPKRSRIRRKVYEENLATSMQEKEILERLFKEKNEIFYKFLSSVTHIMRCKEAEDYLKNNYPQIHRDFSLIIGSLNDKIRKDSLEEVLVS